MIKVIKRYAVVGSLIVACFFSAFISLSNGLFVTAHAKMLIQKETQYAYSNEAIVTIRTTNPISYKEINSLFADVKTCNVYLENMRIYFDQIDSVYIPDVLLLQNEKLSYPTTKEISKLPKGKIIAASTTVSEHEKLSIHGQIFSVFNRMDSEEFPFVTGMFIINADDYFNAFPEVLNNTNEIRLRISSNNEDVYIPYAQIKINLNKVLPGASISSSDVITNDSLLRGSVAQNTLISIGLFGFALINTIIISYYWVIVRRREIAIRKAFGASNDSVIFMMSRELFQLIGLSALLAFIVQFVLSFNQRNMIDFQNAIAVCGLLILAIAMSVFISMIVPVRYILKIQPAEGVRL